MLGEMIMMRKLVIMTMTFCSLMAVAGNDRTKERSTEYKCHFKMTGGAELVHYLMSKDNYASQLQLYMAGKTIYAKDGHTKRVVDEVVECINAEKEFRTFNARQLDKVTLS
jgi:hypothetical protein